MSWECPHQDGEGGTCDRLKGLCRPFSKGCVLYGKGQLMGAGRREGEADGCAPPSGKRRTSSLPDSPNHGMMMICEEKFSC